MSWTAPATSSTRRWGFCLREFKTKEEVEMKVVGGTPTFHYHFSTPPVAECGTVGREWRRPIQIITTIISLISTGQTPPRGPALMIVITLITLTISKWTTWARRDWFHRCSSNSTRALSDSMIIGFEIIGRPLNSVSQWIFNFFIFTLFPVAMNTHFPLTHHLFQCTIIYCTHLHSFQMMNKITQFVQSFHLSERDTL